MIIYVRNDKFAPFLQTTTASAAIVAPQYVDQAKCPVLISPSPYADFARTVTIFFPMYRPQPGVDPSARIAIDAKIGENASIGANAVVGAGTRIGRNAVIHPNATIYPNVSIGDDFTCYSQAVVREGCSIGNRVTILDGAVIGADGFGFDEDRGGLVKMPQVGIVVLEDDVEIGAKSTVDRAPLGATILHRGVKLDDQVHIGHGCEVGEYTRFCAQVGIGGSTKIGKWCLFGGQAAAPDHLTIGDRVMVAARGALAHDAPDGAIMGGCPAVEIKVWRRYVAGWIRLPEILRRLRALEKRFEGDGEK
jgi:UDP-3-O-[3-hydroxymyristoyl] glucosamine N-acyltransferase